MGHQPPYGYYFENNDFTHKQPWGNNPAVGGPPSHFPTLTLCLFHFCNEVESAKTWVLVTFGRVTLSKAFELGYLHL